MTEDEQLALIDRSSSGDLAAFDELVNHFQESVLRFSWNLLNDQHAALDITQETFISAYRQLVKFDPHRATFSTWLLTIARSLALKSRRRQRPIIMEELPDKDTAPQESVESKTHWKESFAKLDETLGTLPASWQRAFILTEIQSLSYQEASQIEAVPIGTIRSRIHRTRTHLRQTLNLQDLL